MNSLFLAIRLVPDEQKNDVRTRVESDFLEPLVNVVKALLVGDVENDKSPDCSAEPTL